MVLCAADVEVRRHGIFLKDTCSTAKLADEYNRRNHFPWYSHPVGEVVLDDLSYSDGQGWGIDSGDAAAS